MAVNGQRVICIEWTDPVYLEIQHWFPTRDIHVYSPGVAGGFIIHIFVFKRSIKACVWLQIVVKLILSIFIVTINNELPAMIRLTSQDKASHQLQSFVNHLKPSLNIHISKIIMSSLKTFYRVAHQQNLEDLGWWSSFVFPLSLLWVFGGFSYPNRGSKDKGCCVLYCAVIYGFGLYK